MATFKAAGRRLLLKARYGVDGMRERTREVIRAQRPVVELEAVQRRLELLVAAMYGRHIPIRPSDPPKEIFLERALKFLNPDPRVREAVPVAEEDAIELPRTLSARDGADAAFARYRLLAIEQAERVARGSAEHVGALDPITRDLYQLREAAAVDAKIARANPGLAASLDVERSAALSRRPPMERLFHGEREVEQLLRDTLAKPAAGIEDAPSDPNASLAWARAKSEEIRRLRGEYRGVPPTSLWGTMRFTGGSIRPPGTQVPTEAEPPEATMGLPAPSNSWRETQNANANEGIGRDQSANDAADKILAPDAPPGHGSDDLAGKETDEVAPWNPDAPRAMSGDSGQAYGQMHQVADPQALDGLPPPIPYDEWSVDEGRYVKGAALVRLYDSPITDDAWSLATLRQHAAIVRQVRHQFERLRARRMLLGRQRAGDELDITACVDAIIDRKVGRSPSDRLYVDARPARRGMAISILVDASGSTEARVTSELRIIDLERIALLMASEALDALGDLYAINAFSGKEASNVKVVPVKAFGERNGESVRARVAALEPGGFTRLGAAVRHSTAQLAPQSAGHRLLLILSDGRPNDVDQYQGDYGVEDSRQAILEARASGVFPFCLTVDANASEYLPRIFGTTGHTILQRPEQLPRALLGAVKTLIGKA